MSLGATFRWHSTAVCSTQHSGDQEDVYEIPNESGVKKRFGEKISACEKWQQKNCHAQRELQFCRSLIAEIEAVES